MFQFAQVQVSQLCNIVSSTQHCGFFFLQQGFYVLLALGPGAPLADLCPRCGGLWGLAFERWTRDSAEEPCLGLCLYGWGWYLDVPSTQTDFSLQGWLILGDVFADEVIEYNLKTSAGILYFIVVEVFRCCSPKNIRTSSGCESHRCMFMFARAKWRFNMCLFFFFLLWYYLIHHTFCEIEYMLYIDERIAKKLLLPPSMAQEPWKSSASVWSVRCLTQSMMLGGKTIWKTYIVTFTTRGWEAWLTIEPWSAMLYSICIHYSRHESYGHADGITHWWPWQLKSLHILGFFRTYERVTRPNLNPSGPVSRWFYFWLCNSGICEWLGISSVFHDAQILWRFSLKY